MPTAGASLRNPIVVTTNACTVNPKIYNKKKSNYSQHLFLGSTNWFLIFETLTTNIKIEHACIRI